MNMDNKEFAELRTTIFTEPTTESKKPDLVRYVKILLNEASQLSADELTGDKGHAIAMSITGALAFQGAQGVNGEDWITKDSEPVLYDILDAAGQLDADPRDKTLWEKLFVSADKL